MTYSVKVSDNIVFQDSIPVATVFNGWGTGYGAQREFLIRSRYGKNSEAISFLKHMLKIMTVSELAEKVKKTSPVEVGAAYGWVMPHLKSWVKRGVITQENLDDMQSRFANEYRMKMG